MSRKSAFATERNTFVTLGLLSVLLAFALAMLPLVVAPAFA
jgi:hypothetical protein